MKSEGSLLESKIEIQANKYDDLDNKMFDIRSTNECLLTPKLKQSFLQPNPLKNDINQSSANIQQVPPNYSNPSPSNLTSLHTIVGADPALSQKSYTSILNKKPSRPENSNFLTPNPQILSSKLNFLQKTLKFSFRLTTDQIFNVLNSALLSLKPSDLRQLNKILCSECFKVQIPFPLSCGHTICGSCFQESLQTLLLSPSLLNLKAASCKTCYQNFSKHDIKCYAADLLENFEQLQVMIHCEICNRSLKANENYWAETPCFDMCSSCYSDALFMKSKCCPACNLEFKHKDFSLVRASLCTVCGRHEKSVLLAYRTLDQTYCFYCLEKLAETENLSNQTKRLLKIYLNKTCVLCKTPKNIADLLIKPCCDLPICESCSDFCPFHPKQN